MAEITNWVKKIWKNRTTEFPTRRTLMKEDGSSEIVTVTRNEGTVSEEGDAFDADTMNNLEERIDAGFTELNGKIENVNSTLNRKIENVNSTLNGKIENVNSTLMKHGSVELLVNAEANISQRQYTIGKSFSNYRYIVIAIATLGDAGSYNVVTLPVVIWKQYWASFQISYGNNIGKAQYVSDNTILLDLPNQYAHFMIYGII